MSYSYSDPSQPNPNSRLKRNIIIAVVLVILVVVGLFAFRFAMAPKGPPMGGGGAMGVPVMSENPRSEKAAGKVEAVGTLRADQSISVAAEVDGRIDSIPGMEGKLVKKGELLVQLDQAITKAELAEAESALSLAKATYGRRKNLATRQFATRQSEDEALANMRATEARVASARARFEKTSVLAPFDGVLGLRAKSLGAYTRAGEAIFTLTSVDPIFVDFRIPELKSARAEPGQKVAVNVPALGVEAADGEVTAVDPALDESGRSLAVRAKLPNKDGKLRAGMFAQVSLIYSTPRDVLVVPERAVFLQNDGSYVYRAKDGKAELVKVVLGDRHVGEVEVLEGLTANDDIITDGQIKVRPGAPVMLLNKPNVPQDNKTAAPETKPEDKKTEEKKPSAVIPATAPPAKPDDDKKSPFIPAPAEKKE
jgi:membrane fusion protein, multidrug efflux system